MCSELILVTFNASCFSCNIYIKTFSLSNTRVYFSIFDFSILVTIRVVHLMEHHWLSLRWLTNNKKNLHHILKSHKVQVFNVDFIGSIVNHLFISVWLLIFSIFSSKYLLSQISITHLLALLPGGKREKSLWENFFGWLL